MTTLPVGIKTGGFDLHRLQRQGNFAIYAQSKRGTIVSYEVVEVQHHPAATIMGRSYDEREGYPSNEQWGICAWTCNTLARANERFAGLLR